MKKGTPARRKPHTDGAPSLWLPGWPKFYRTTGSRFAPRSIRVAKERVVRDILGHRRPDMTAHYSTIRMNEKKEAAHMVQLIQGGQGGLRVPGTRDEKRCRLALFLTCLGLRFVREHLRAAVAGAT